MKWLKEQLNQEGEHVNKTLEARTESFVNYMIDPEIDILKISKDAAQTPPFWKATQGGAGSEVFRAIMHVRIRGGPLNKI